MNIILAMIMLGDKHENVIMKDNNIKNIYQIKVINMFLELPDSVSVSE